MSTPAVIAVMKLEEENHRLRMTVSALSAMLAKYEGKPPPEGVPTRLNEMIGEPQLRKAHTAHLRPEDYNAPYRDPA